MYKRFLFALYFLSLLAVLPLRATVYGLDVFTREHKQIVLFSDVHIQTPDEAKQKQDVLRLAQEAGATLIVEDMFDIGLSNDLFKDLGIDVGNVSCANQYSIEEAAKKPKFLHGLTVLARDRDINVINLEFRHLEGSSSGDISLGITEAHQLALTKTLYHQCLQRLRGFVVPGVFTQLYGDLNQLTVEHDKSVLSNLSSKLFDLTALKTILEPGSNTIFVCAGALHIDFLKRELLVHSWECTFSRGVDSCFYEAMHEFARTQKLAEMTSENEIRWGRYLRSYVAKPIDIEQALYIVPHIAQQAEPQVQSRSWASLAKAALTVTAVAAVAYGCYKAGVCSWVGNKIQQFAGFCFNK